MKIEVKATVTYTYELSDKEEEKLARIIRNIPDEFRYMTDNQKVAHAFEMLYASNDTELYENDRTTMSDFRTDEFLYSEFNDIDAEDWLDNNKLRPEMYMNRREQSCK